MCVIKLRRVKEKKRWNEEEISCLLTEFKEHISAKRNPSFIEIREAQNKFPCLKQRACTVIKSQVNNIILGKCKVALAK